MIYIYVFNFLSLHQFQIAFIQVVTEAFAEVEINVESAFQLLKYWDMTGAWAADGLFEGDMTLDDLYRK